MFRRSVAAAAVVELVHRGVPGIDSGLLAQWFPPLLHLSGSPVS